MRRAALDQEQTNDHRAIKWKGTHAMLSVEEPEGKSPLSEGIFVLPIRNPAMQHHRNNIIFFVSTNPRADPVEASPARN
jgi:hypothetical protein